MHVEQINRTETILVVNLPKHWRRADVLASMEALIKQARAMGAVSSTASPLPAAVAECELFASGDGFTVRYIAAYDVLEGRMIGRVDTVVELP